MAVTTSTCILCHFKGQKAGEGTARCTLCHQIPKMKSKSENVSFDHAKAERFGMDCTWCHAQPAGSGGQVPKERCVTCHNQAARLEKYNDTQLLHQKHVTDHKVDCMDCHLHLEHVAPVGPQMAAARIETAATECRACHETGHSPQLSLYTGTGGRGVEAMPSVMFQAGVRCEGCHTELPGHAAAVNRASNISCMACHGAAYEKIYRNWREGSAQRTAALARQLDETARALGGSGSTQLADARLNLGLVTRGHAIHNIPYAYALLRKAHEDMNAARRGRGLAPLPRPWQEPPYQSPCLECHEGIEGQRGTIFGKAFAHAGHVVTAKIDCVRCHRPHAERTEDEIVRYDASGCISCHHKPPVKDCLTCHAAVRKGVVKSFRGDFDHAMHLDEAEKACADCHDVSAAAPVLKKEACKECHED
jgi:hypothetical protein